MVGGQQKNKTRQDNLVELEASLAPAGAEVGAVAKADQKILGIISLSPGYAKSPRKSFRRILKLCMGFRIGLGEMESTKQTNSDSKLFKCVSIYSHKNSFSIMSLGFIHQR